jgi:hypothetical protein
MYLILGIFCRFVQEMALEGLEGCPGTEMFSLFALVFL